MQPKISLSLTRKLVPCVAPTRRFNINNIQKAVRKEFGQDLADDFLPEREELEIQHQLKMESSMRLQQRPDSMLRHGEDFNGVLFKYDLPTVNLPIVFRST